MDTNGGPLSFEALINDSNWQARLDAMERRMIGFGNTTAQQGSKIDSVFQNIGKLAATGFAINGLSQLPQELFKVRSEFEALEISFTTMLRSKSKADAFLKEGAAFAATSPFSLRDVGNAQKQLLAYGVSVNEIIPSLRRLGDISAGLSLPLERLTYLYGTTKTQGRLFAQDLNQFVGSGIPLIAELAKQFGVAEDKVRGLVEDGKVGFKEVKKAIEGMTSGSGIFAGTLDAQSKSLLGLSERLGDAYDAMLNDIGKKNQDIAVALFSGATSAVQHYQDVINIVEVLAATYGTYRAAILLVSVAQRAQIILLQSVALEQGLAAAAGEVLTAQQARQIVVSKLLQQAQASLNTTMLANPYVLVGTALAALVTTYLVYREELQQVKTAQELLADSAKDISGSFKQQGAEATRLIGVIKNQNVAESERLKAYDQLKSIAPEIIGQLDFQRAKTADLTKELNLYLVSLEKKIRLESAQSAFKAAVDQDIEAAERLKKAQDALTKQNGLPSAVVIGTGPNASGAASISGLAQAKDELNKAVAAKAKAAQAIKDVETSINTIYTGGSKDFINAEIARIELLRSKITDKLSPAYKNAEDSLNALTKQRDALTAAEAGGVKTENLTVKAIQDKIRAKREELSLTNNTDAQNAKIRQEIATLEAQERKLTGKKTKAEKDADKVGPLGSLSYYDNVIKKTDEALSKVSKDDSKNIARLLAVKTDAEQKAAEIRTLLETPAGSVKYFEGIASAAQAALEKTPVINTAAIERQKQIIIDAQAQAEEARKLIVIRSFDEELAYKRSQYELYQKWVEAYGKQSADTQFANLKKSGEDYLDFLNKQIAQLENDKENVGLTDVQAGNLSSLRDQRQELTGQKTAIDQFRDSLQQARNSSASLADYLDILKQKQAELNTKPNTQEYLALRQQVATDLVDTQQQLSRELNGYLQNVTGAEEQRLAVTKRFADLRLALENRYIGKIKDAAYATTKAQIDKGEKDEIKEIEEKATQASDAYKKLDEVILSSGRKAQRERLALLNDYLKKEKAAADTQTYKIKLKERDDTVATIKNEDIARLSEYGQLVGQFGNALISMGGDAAESGQALVSLAGTIGLVAESFKKNVDKSQLYATAISGLVTLFSAITDAAAKRKQTESEYYASVIAQQQQYNLLLNEQLAIRSKNSNPFIDDYTAQLKDNFEAQRQAQAKLDESLKKLNEGRAKEGLKNQLDNASALKLIGTGAGTGAAIGALISGPLAPVGAAIGAVIGGAVGALTSLFGGATKKADEFGALLERYPGLIEQSADGTKRVNLALAQTLIDTGQLDDKTKALVQTTIEWQKQVDATKQSIQDIIKNLVGQLGDGLRDAMVNAFKEGTDAAQAFSDVLSKVIEDFVTKLLYTQIFAPYFKKLGEEMTKSLDTANGGDGNIIDDLKRFQQDTAEGQKQYIAYLQQWKDYSESMGFDKVLKPAGTSGTRNPNSMGQAIQASVTEATANILAGQLNAIRISQETGINVVRQQLLALNNIDRNTARIERTNDLLESVDKRLRNIESTPGRGLGQPG